MKRATAATLAVVISLSGAGPLLAEGAERSDSPSLERVLKLLQQPESSGLVPLARPRALTATHPDASLLQAGSLHQHADPPRRGGNATMIVVLAPVSSPFSTFLMKSLRPFFLTAVTASNVAMATSAARMGV